MADFTSPLAALSLVPVVPECQVTRLTNGPRMTQCQELSRFQHVHEASWPKPAKGGDEKDRILSPPVVPPKAMAQVSHCEEHPKLSLANGLFDDLLPLCFGFLDLASLANCARVSRLWHQQLETPRVWWLCYNTNFRHQQDFCFLRTWSSSKQEKDEHEEEEESSSTFAARAAVVLSRWSTKQIKRLCIQRLRMQWTVSSRATTWIRHNGNILMHNDSLLRNFFAGSIESLRSEKNLEPLAFGLLLGTSVCYFEASFTGCGSIGIVSISCKRERLAYGFGSESHVGWFPVSYGYHSDNGAVYWNDGIQSPVGGNDMSYGPSWGHPVMRHHLKQPRAPSIVGCGFFIDTKRLFFTLNGRFLKFVPLVIDASRVYAGAVSLHQLDDTAEINSGRNAFCFDIESFVLHDSLARSSSSRASIVTAA